MSEFKVQVHRIKIEEHPNADALELAVVGGYRSCVQKGAFRDGQLVVYIPEQAIVPDWLIAELGLEGKLAGKSQNRVKAIKLRGILSQGLVWDGVDPERTQFEGLVHSITRNDIELRVKEGDDVTSFLGIEKYEPQIPTNMDGKVHSMFGKTLRYDIENWKNYPEVLKDGERVVFTEKLHGTWSCFGIYLTDRIVTSKGFSTKGLAFTLGEENENNLYVKMHYAVGKHLVDVIAQLTHSDIVYVLGEIFGRGVQDLHYGQTEPQYRVFDIAIGNYNGGVTDVQFIEPHNMQTLLDNVDKFWVEKTGEPLGVQTVPFLYDGPFSVEVMEEYTDGKDTISNSNVREGIVMRPVTERWDNELGRVILKSVSGDYLTRKGDATEYN